MTAALEGGEWSAARLGRTLPPEKARYPFYRRLGGPQGRSGRAENLVPTTIRSRIVQPVAQSLYRLSYPDTLYTVYINLCTLYSIMLDAPTSQRTQPVSNTYEGQSWRYTIKECRSWSKVSLYKILRKYSHWGDDLIHADGQTWRI